MKDTDDLAQLRMLELLGPGGHRRVETARVRAEQAIAASRPPFDDRWPRWRPPADARPLRLPAAGLAVGNRAEAPTASDFSRTRAGMPNPEPIPAARRIREA